VRSLLLPLAWIFGLIVAVRNAAFSLGIFRSKKVGIPVISAGNISAGGTGKTPLVEEIARMLTGAGMRTGVLSRGFGRSTSGFRWVQNGARRDTDAALCGDEPVQIAHNVPEAFVAVDENRVRGALRMIREAGIQVLVLDDGFQHRWIHRLIDIVVMTETELLKGDALLPAGRRREPMRSIRRATAVVLTGCSEESGCPMLIERVHRISAVNVFCSAPVISGYRELSSGKEVDASFFSEHRIALLSGIGNPDGFEQAVRMNGVSVVAHHVHGDHYAYGQKDVEKICEMLDSGSCDALLMTQKDAVRMMGSTGRDLLKDRPLYYTMMHPRWFGDPTAFEMFVMDVLRKESV
jgi:tetraacyldisaccharide 4'-kinase